MATLRFTVEHTYTPTGGPGINVWHYRTGTELGAQEDIDEAAIALRTFYTNISGLFPPGSTHRLRPQVLDVDTSEVRAATVWSVVGTAGSSLGYLPTAVAVCLNWRTTNVSRSGRGRTFLGPLSSVTLEANGTPTPATQNTVGNAAAALITALAGAGNGSFGVRSEAAGVFRDHVSGYTRDQFAVLRSRRD